MDWSSCFHAGEALAAAVNPSLAVAHPSGCFQEKTEGIQWANQDVVENSTSTMLFVVVPENCLSRCITRSIVLFPTTATARGVSGPPCVDQADRLGLDREAFQSVPNEMIVVIFDGQRPSLDSPGHTRIHMLTIS